MVSIAKKYIEGLKNAYAEAGLSDEWEGFEKVMHGASEDEFNRVKAIYPDCPVSLLDLLCFVDGTYYRQYGEETICFYFLGSDVYEYPYYLLSLEEICANQNMVIDHYSDYIERAYDEVEMDDRVTGKIEGIKWLHFSDCMNNGGTSQLFIDFTPSATGKVGQVVRFLHDPDEFKVIADSFDEYLQNIIDEGFGFINEDITE